MPKDLKVIGCVLGMVYFGAGIVFVGIPLAILVVYQPWIGIIVGIAAILTTKAIYNYLHK